MMTDADRAKTLTEKLANELFIEPTELQTEPIAAALLEAMRLTHQADAEIARKTGAFGKYCSCCGADTCGQDIAAQIERQGEE